MIFTDVTLFMYVVNFKGDTNCIVKVSFFI